jgi:formylglycine-generating enzyme required for sulfatase activity
MALVLAAALIYVQTDKAKESAAAPPKGAPEPWRNDPRDARPPTPVKYVVNSIGMKLAPIPPGEFTMGSRAEEIERVKKEPHGWEPPGLDQVEGPRHKVKITKAFALGAYEVTQGQYEKVMGQNPSANKESPDHPVEQVNWDEAVAFCTKLSGLPAEKKAGRVYRLPTEAEWEYACRAGTTTVFHCGDSLSSRQANFMGDHPFGYGEKGPRAGKTVKVGSYPPNAWGLHDMHGNVYEWCLDGARTYTPDAAADPRGPVAAGADRVLRGGSWGTGAWYCRSAFRKERPPSTYRTNHSGFRVVCEQRGPGPARE